AFDLLERLAAVERGHELARLLRVLRHLSVIEVGREREETLRREPLEQRADVIIHAPPLLDEHHARRLAGACGHGQLAARLLAGLRLELDPGRRHTVLRALPRVAGAGEHSRAADMVKGLPWICSTSRCSAPCSSSCTSSGISCSRRSSG